MSYLLPTTIEQVSEVSSIELKSLLEDSDDITANPCEFYSAAFKVNEKTSAFCGDDDLLVSPEERTDVQNDAAGIFSNYTSGNHADVCFGEFPQSLPHNQHVDTYGVVPQAPLQNKQADTYFGESQQPSPQDQQVSPVDNVGFRNATYTGYTFDGRTNTDTINILHQSSKNENVSAFVNDLNQNAQPQRSVHHGNQLSQLPFCVQQISQAVPSNDAFQDSHLSGRKRKYSETICKEENSDSGNIPIALTPSDLLSDLKVNNDLRSATEDAVKQRSPVPLIKQELKCKIQSKRLIEGKDELEVSFDSKTDYKLRPDEKEKIEKRKMLNRNSAKRSREKSKQKETQIEKEHEELMASNKKLVEEIQNLEKQKEDLTRIIEVHSQSLLCALQKENNSFVHSETPTINVFRETGRNNPPSNTSIINGVNDHEQEGNQHVTSTNTTDILDLVLDFDSQVENDTANKKHSMLRWDG